MKKYYILYIIFTLMRWMTVHMYVWCAPLLAIQDFKMCAKPYEQIISLLKM